MVTVLHLSHIKEVRVIYMKQIRSNACLVGIGYGRLIIFGFGYLVEKI